MSGIVASYLNHRGSGLIANFGTDGQVFTSTGVGLSQGFEAAAGGGKVLQCVGNNFQGHQDVTSTTATASTVSIAITPTSASNKIFVSLNSCVTLYDNNQTQVKGGISIYRDIASGGFSEMDKGGTATEGSTVAFMNADPEVGGLTLLYWRFRLDVWDTTHNTTGEITYKVYISEPQANDNYFCLGEGKSSRSLTAYEIDQS